MKSVRTIIMCRGGVKMGFNFKELISKVNKKILQLLLQYFLLFQYVQYAVMNIIK